MKIYFISSSELLSPLKLRAKEFPVSGWGKPCIYIISCENAEGWIPLVTTAVKEPKDYFSALNSQLSLCDGKWWNEIPGFLTSLVCNRLRRARSRHLAFQRTHPGRKKTKPGSTVHHDQFYCLGTGAVVSKGLHSDQQLKPRWTESPLGSGQHSDRPDQTPVLSRTQIRQADPASLALVVTDLDSVCLRPPAQGFLVF